MWSVLLALVPLAEAKKNKAPPPPPPVGWHSEVGWKAACWHPPTFAGMLTGPLKEARQQTLEAIVSQWRGDKGDGISFPVVVYENLETVVLADMNRLERVAKENLEQCKAAMAGGGDASKWQAWMESLPGSLTVGECNWPPLDYTMYDYLNVNQDWQITGHVCKGDRIRIKAAAMDYFRLEAKGEFFNLAGDPARPTSGEYPCNVEGCLAGMLVLRFTSETGTQTVHPIGLEGEFLVPEHGRIQVMVNDTDLTDNAYKVENRLVHHASIEYSAANK